MKYRIASTHDAAVVMKRIVLVLPFVLGACDTGPTEPRTILVPTAGTLSADRGANGQEADRKEKKHHTFEATFTKWRTVFPHMVGVVGGDVGDGTFAGEILSVGTVGTITNIEALYHFTGERHTFNAHVYVTQDNVTHTAVITGRVTDGWLKDALVAGQYTVWAVCPIPTPGNGAGTLCFQGVLHIQKHGGDQRSTGFRKGDA